MENIQNLLAENAAYQLELQTIKKDISTVATEVTKLLYELDLLDAQGKFIKDFHIASLLMKLPRLSNNSSNLKQLLPILLKYVTYAKN